MTTIGGRIVETLGGVTKEAVDLALREVMKETEAAVSRAYEAGYSDANDDPASGDIAAGGFGYRKMSNGLRDFTDVSREDAMKVAWSLWVSSPIARRLLTLKRDHIIGRNTTPIADNEELQEILDDFWKHNRLRREAGRFALQLFLFGEQCFPAAVRKSDGAVEVGYFDPESIEDVITHPDNDLLPVAVVIKPITTDQTWRSNTTIRIYRIIQQDRAVVDGDNVRQPKYEGMLVTAEQANRWPWEENMLEAHGVSDYAGSVFFFAVNNVSNMARGSSDLLPLADWIDQADETLFALADREQTAGYFSWDVSLTGADEDKIALKSKQIRNRPPKKGSVNVHNESESWTLNAPDLKQQGSIETYRALLGLILGGLGFPVHWFGYGDDANRATAVAQASPTEKTLEHDQGLVHDMLITMLEFARDQAIIAGKWRGDDDEVKIDLPEVSPRNMGTVAETMQKLALALTAAEQAGWISQETAAETFGKLLGDFGIEVNPQEEIEQPLPDDTTKQNGDSPGDVVESYFRRMGIND